MSHDRYYEDLALAWTIRIVVAISLVATMVALGGCSHKLDANSSGSITIEPRAM